MNATNATKADATGPKDTVQYLSFSLAGEEYAVDILRVQEIRGICPITALPHSPPHVRGVMNLRGAVVPVVDMRAALGLADEAYGQFTVIIVVSARGRTMGFVVDSVSDVLSLDASTIERAPDLGSRVDASMVAGIARTQERFVVVLDIDRVADRNGHGEATAVTGSLAAKLSPQEFQRLRTVIHDVAGIQLRDNKHDLVAGRLGSRLKALGLSSFTEYLRVLSHDAGGAETRELVNCITTNKTSFFREPHHFDFIKRRVVPEILERARRGGPRRIRIWSAGCSMGQEPWSVAMTLADALGSLAGWDVRILASDLDTQVLETAERAVYSAAAIEEVPAGLRARFFERHEGGHRVAASLRSLVTFRHINLAAPSSWRIRTRFDVVLCRNTAIYFDRDTQELLFKGLAAHLEPTGYLMSGHSENLHWLSNVLKPIGHTVHVLASGADAAIPRAAPRPASLRPPRVPPRIHHTRSTPPGAALSPRRLAAYVHRASVERAGPAGVKEEIYIQVGGVRASATGALIRTTLGSCVATCLFDPVAKVGGMNHFLLPDEHGDSREMTSFGVHAMEVLINAIMKLGGDRRRLVAKVFGAAELFASGTANHVGKRNSTFALRFLEEESIPVVGQKLGGASPLSVQLDTVDGRARVAVVGTADGIAQAEDRQRALLAVRQPIEDAVVFFRTP